MSSTFEAVTRRSGNSLTITIPYNVVKAHKIEPGTALSVSIRLMGDKEEK